MEWMFDVSKAMILDSEGRFIATTCYRDHPVTAQDIRNARMICAAVNAVMQVMPAHWTDVGKTQALKDGYLRTLSAEG